MNAMSPDTMLPYGYKQRVAHGFEDAVQRTRDALAKRGFGVLTEIDVAATLKKKLNVDFEPYLILGACNPPFAHRALLSEHDIGLLLPCNVIVYERSGSVFVSAIEPSVAMGMVDNDALAKIAADIETMLHGIVDEVARP